MKRTATLYIIMCALCILAGCGGGSMPAQLRAVSEVANEQPDSALRLLDALQGERAQWGEEARMRYELLRLKAQNKLYIDFPDDSLPRVLVDYFDRHGSRNDRVLARYMLGRAYHAMGDAPMALETYLDGIALADTLSPDCDLDALRGIYGQMSAIYHQQNLPYDELRAMRRHIEYTERCCDEKAAIIARSQLVRPYFLLGMEDSILKIQEDTRRRLMQLGDTALAAGGVVTSIFYYTKRGEMEKARRLMDLFEQKSGLFDAEGNQPPPRDGYFYIKAHYMLTAHQLDSAEYYYRKSVGCGYLKEGYRGLLNVYRERHNADSIARYSLLFEEGQDSLHDQMRTEAIHQMSALYDYSRSQRQAEQEAAKARAARMWIAAVVAVALFIVALLVGLYRRSQTRRRREIHALSNALWSARIERQTVQDELSRLKAKDYESLIAEKERREQQLQQTIDDLQATVESNLQSAKGHSAGGTASVGEDSPTPPNRLGDFTCSRIVQLFQKKSQQKTERPIPSEAEWRLLEAQFASDMPATYARFCSGRKLSPLEYRVCILLILGYSEGTIQRMTEKSPQTITTTKARANDKLFGLREASSLKGNLLRA